MSELPSAVGRLLRQILLVERHAAWIEVDREGRVLGSGGELSRHELDPGVGDDVFELLPALHGMLEGDTPIHLPLVMLQDRHWVDVHVQAEGERRWILLLTSTADALARRGMQQRLNERELLAGSPGPGPDPAGPELRRLLSELNPRGERRWGSVLCGDLRGYTSFVERGAAERSLLFIRRLTRELPPKVLDRRGVVREWRGDHFEVIFGLRSSAHAAAVDAVQAAKDVIDQARSIRAKRQKRGEPSLVPGIGIATGELTLGRFGGRGQRRLLVAGEVVRRARLIEREAAPGEILLDPATHQAVEELGTDFEPRELRLGRDTLPTEAWSRSLRS